MSAQPPPRSVAEVQGFIDLIIEEAPHRLVEAVACLMDDAVAEKAYEVICKCKR